VIITKTPFRISFFGGGTDYPDYYHEHGGSVLSTTIDKYCCIACRYLPPFFEHKYRIVYSKIENKLNIKDIDHPAVRGVLEYIENFEGLEIHYFGDLPARSGLGSSSSFTVGLLNAVNALKNNTLSKESLAFGALDIEQNLLGEAVGSQDQVSAAYGGLNRIDFDTGGKFKVTPVNLSLQRKEELENNTLLLFTGVTRFSGNIAQKKIDNLSKNLTGLHQMKEQVDEGVSILSCPNRSLKDFGKLLNDGWQLKRELAQGVTNSKIDEMYQAGISGGALGGKLLGAGGGGFMMFYVEKKNHQSVINKLGSYLHIPVKFENHGSAICLLQPDSN